MDVREITARVDGLETAIANVCEERIEPLAVDRWIAASVLQKAIRRNDVQTALRSALTLWTQDRRSFWRRLHTISVEDVGVAAPDAINQTLTALNAPSWRNKVGDWKVALYLTRLLCGSVKSRLGDELYTIANKSPDLNRCRVDLLRADKNALCDAVLDQDRPLPERCLALWLLAGTKRFPCDSLPERDGSLDDAADVLRSLGAPDDLTTACIGAMAKTQWTLVLFTPLLWQAVQNESCPLSVMVDAFPVSLVMHGVPFCALDGFTRVGKACFAELKRSTPALKPFSAKQIALAVFYGEGFYLDKRLTSDTLEDCRQAGELADAHGAGMDMPEYLGLKEIVADNIDRLDAIRRKQLQLYFDKPQGAFVFGEDASWM
jgi:hypothetical protein